MQGTTSQPLSLAEQAKSRLGAREFDLKHHRRPGEEAIRLLLLVCGIISVFTTIGIVFVLAGNTLNFFQSRAFVFAKAPVAQAEPLATLSSAITDSQTSFAVAYRAEGTQVNNRQYLSVGDEIMQVVSRTRSKVTVARGQNGTTAQAIPAGTPIYPMREQQARPVEAMTADDITLTIPEGFEQVFAVNEEIRLGTEIMLVTAIDGNVLTVQRGYAGSLVAAHDTETTIAKAEYVTLGKVLTTTTWQPQTGQYGIWALVTATLLTSLIALVFAIPLGLGAAMYLSEYAKPSTRNTLKPILEILAGIPTVVYGFFALTFVTPTLKNLLFGSSLNSLNMLAAGLTIGVLITPLISSMCEDAISAVPRSLREASYGLGATKFETTIHVILPAAASGISAAIIVAMSRAVGETMIVLLASGAGPNFTFDLRQSAETMAGHIARISTGDIEYGSLDYTSIFAVGMTLFMMTFALNIISNQVSRRLRERY